MISWKAFLRETEKRKKAPLNALDLTSTQREYVKSLQETPAWEWADEEQQAEALSYVYGIPKEQLKDVNFDDETYLLKHTFRNYYNKKGIPEGQEGPLSFFTEDGSEDPDSPGLLKYDLSQGALTGWGEEVPDKDKGKYADVFLDRAGRARIARSPRQLKSEEQTHIENMITAQLNAEKDEEHTVGDLFKRDIPSAITDYGPMMLGSLLEQGGRMAGAEGITETGQQMRYGAEERLAGKPQPFDMAKIAAELGKNPEDLGFLDFLNYGIAHGNLDELLGATAQQIPILAGSMAGPIAGAAIGTAVGGPVGTLIGGAAGAGFAGFGEGVIEANETYNTARQSGKTHEEAMKLANEVTLKNTILNTFINAADFIPGGVVGRAAKSTYRGLTGSLLRTGAMADDTLKASSKLRRIADVFVNNEDFIQKFATRGGRMAARIPFEAAAGVGAMFMEGSQEWTQFGFQEEAKGNDFWTHSSQRDLEGFLGGIAGVGGRAVVSTSNLFKLSESIEQRIAGLTKQLESELRPEKAAALEAQIEGLEQLRQFTPALIDDWAQRAISSGARPEDIMAVVEESKNGITKRAAAMSLQVDDYVFDQWNKTGTRQLPQEGADGQLMPGGEEVDQVPQELADNLVRSIKMMEEGQLPNFGDRKGALSKVHEFINGYYSAFASDEEKTQFAHDVYKRVFGEEVPAGEEWAAKTPETRARLEQKFTRGIEEKEAERHKGLTPHQRRMEGLIVKYDMDPQTASFFAEWSLHVKDGHSPTEAYNMALWSAEGRQPAFTKEQALTMGLPVEVADELQAAHDAVKADVAAAEAASPDAFKAKIAGLKASLKVKGTPKEEKLKIIAQIKDLQAQHKAEEERKAKAAEEARVQAAIKSGEEARAQYRAEKTAKEEAVVQKAIAAPMVWLKNRADAARKAEKQQQAALESRFAQAEQADEELTRLDLAALAEKRRGGKGAVQKRGAKAVPVGESPGGGPQVVERGETFEEAQERAKQAGLAILGQPTEGVGQEAQPEAQVAETPKQKKLSGLNRAVDLAINDRRLQTAPRAAPRQIKFRGDDKYLTDEEIAEVQQTYGVIADKTAAPETKKAAADRLAQLGELVRQRKAETKKLAAEAKPEAEAKPAAEEKPEAKAQPKDHPRVAEIRKRTTGKKKPTPPPQASPAPTKEHRLSEEAPKKNGLLKSGAVITLRDGTDAIVTSVEENKQGLTTVKAKDSAPGSKEYTLTEHAEQETGMTIRPSRDLMAEAVEKTRAAEKRELEKAAGPIYDELNRLYTFLDEKRAPDIEARVQERIDFLVSQLEGTDRPARKRGEGTAPDMTEGAPAAKGVEPEDIEAPTVPESRPEDLRIAQVKEKEAAQARIGQEWEDAWDARRRGTVLHPSGTGLGAALPEGAKKISIAVHSGEELWHGPPSIEERKPAKDVAGEEETPKPRRGILKKIFESKEPSRYAPEKIRTNMTAFIAAAEADKKLLKKHGVTIVTFEDRTIVTGSRADVINFYLDARKYATTDAENGRINQIVSKLYMDHGTENGMEVNSKEFRKDYEDLVAGTFEGTVKPTRREQGLELTPDQKLQVLQKLRGTDRGARIAKRIMDILSLAGFKNVKELGIQAYMGHTGKVRLAIVAAQKRSDGTWGALHESSRAATQEEFDSLQRNVQKKIAAILISEVGELAAQGIMVDSYGFSIGPENWPEYVKSSGRKYDTDSKLIPEDEFVTSDNQRIHYMEPIYKSDRSHYSDEIDLGREKVLRKWSQYYKAIDETKKKKLLAEIDHIQKVIDEDLKPKRASARQKLGLPDFDHHTFTRGTKHLSAVSNSEWEKDLEIKLKPLTIRDRVGINFDLLMQAGLENMTEEQRKKYSEDEEYRAKIDDQWQREAIKADLEFRSEEATKRGNHRVAKALAAEIFEVDTIDRYGKKSKSAIPMTWVQKAAFHRSKNLAAVVAARYGSGRNRALYEEFLAVGEMGIIDAIMRLDNYRALGEATRKGDFDAISEINEHIQSGQLYAPRNHLINAAQKAVALYQVRNVPLSIYNIENDLASSSEADLIDSRTVTDEVRFMQVAASLYRNFVERFGHPPNTTYLVNKIRNLREKGRNYSRFNKPDLPNRVAAFLESMNAVEIDKMLIDSEGAPIINAIADPGTRRSEGEQYTKLLNKELRQSIAKNLKLLTPAEREVTTLRLGLRMSGNRLIELEGGERAVEEVSEILGLPNDQVFANWESARAKLQRVPELAGFSEEYGKTPTAKPKRNYVTIDRSVTEALRGQYNEKALASAGVTIEEGEGRDVIRGAYVDIQAILDPSNFTKASESTRAAAVAARTDALDRMRPEDMVESLTSFADKNGAEVGIGELVLASTRPGVYARFRVKDVQRTPGGTRVVLVNDATGNERVVDSETVPLYGFTRENIKSLIKNTKAKLQSLKDVEGLKRQAPSVTVTDREELEAKFKAARKSRKAAPQILLSPRVAKLIEENRAKLRILAVDTAKKAGIRAPGREDLVTAGEAQKISGAPDETMELIKRIERASGKIVLYSNSPDETWGGVFDPSNPNIIYVNVAYIAEGQENVADYMFQVVLHEYVHSVVAKMDPKDYERLLRLVGISSQNIAPYDITGWGTIVTMYLKYAAEMEETAERIERASREGRDPLDADIQKYVVAEFAIVDELVTAMIQDRAKITKFLDHVRKQDPDFFQKVVAFLRQAAKNAVKLMKHVVTASMILERRAAKVEAIETFMDELAEREAPESFKKIEDEGLFAEIALSAEKKKQPKTPDDVFPVEGGPGTSWASDDPFVRHSPAPPSSEAATAQRSILDFLDEVDTDPTYFSRQSRAVREGGMVEDADRVPAMMTNNSAPLPNSTPGINDHVILGKFPKLIQTLRAIAPLSFSRQAKETARSLRSELGAAERRRSQAASVLKGAKSYIDDQIKKNGESWSIDIIDKIENGKINEIQDPVTRDIASAIRQLLDSRAAMIAAIDPSLIGMQADLMANYFPHIWEMNDNARSIMYRRDRERASFQGNTALTKQRLYKTIKDGLADGLKLKDPNFVTLATMRLTEEDRFIAANRFMKSALASGRARWYTTQSEDKQKKEQAKDYATRLKEARAKAGHKLSGEEKAKLRQEFSTENPPVGWVPIDDPMARIAGQPSKRLWMPPDAANVLNNFLTRSILKDVPVFEAYRKMSNFANQLQLGWSLFHVMFTALDASANQLSVGLKYLLLIPRPGGGKFFRKAMFSIISSPIAGVTNLAAGREIRAAYKRHGEVARAVPRQTNEAVESVLAASRYAGKAPAGVIGGLLGLDRSETGVQMNEKALQFIINAIERAGGAVEMDEFYRTHKREELKKAWKERKALGVAWHGIPGLTEMFSSVILERIVPSQKIGAFYQLARYEVDRLGPDAAPEQIDEALQKAWDTIDDRMGQLVYNNLFWNKAFKDVLMASFRAVGWTFGSLRAGLGGIKDFFELGRKIVTPGEKVDIANDITHRMTYMFAMPAMVMLMGYLLQEFLGGGDVPDEEDTPWYKNLLYPKTGKMDIHGRPERVQLASYMKDVKAWTEDPTSTFFNKLHPVLHMASNMVAGTDFLGNRITEPDDNIVKKGWDNLWYVIKDLMPFSFRNAKRHIDTTGDYSVENYLKGFGPSFFGIVPAPASSYRSKAENVAAKLSSAGQEYKLSEKQQERSKKRKQLLFKMAQGQKSFTPEELGPLGRSEIKKTRTSLKKPSIIRSISRLPAEEALVVWEKMTPKEKSLSRRFMITKLSNAIKNTSDSEEKLQLRESIERIRSETRGE